MIQPKITNIIACIILVSIGGYIATRQEIKARNIKRSIKKRRAENLAEVPIIKAKLEDQSLSEEERNKLKNVLGRREKGMPHAPRYAPYNERIVGWPIGIFLTLGGIACLFFKSSKSVNEA